MASHSLPEDEDIRLGCIVEQFLDPLPEAYASLRSDVDQNDFLKIMVNRFCLRKDHRTGHSTIVSDPLAKINDHVQALVARQQDLLRFDSRQEQLISPPTTPAVREKFVDVTHEDDVEMQDADEDCEAYQNEDQSHHEYDGDGECSNEVDADLLDVHAKDNEVSDDVDLEEAHQEDLEDSLTDVIKNFEHPSKKQKSHGRRRSDWKYGTTLGAAVKRVFANTTKLLRHPDDPKDAPYTTLISAIVDCCRDQLKWSDACITGAQADVLELVALTLSEQSFAAMLATGQSLLTAQLDAKKEENYAAEEETLSDANKIFAKALRNFQALGRKKINDGATSDLLLNLAYSNLASSNQKALHDMRAEIGLPPTAPKIISWLIHQLNNADIDDEYKLVEKLPRTLNCVQAIRILQYYQNVRTTSAYEASKPETCKQWSRKVGDDLNRGKKVECFTSFDIATAALLPHARRLLESVRITEENEDAVDQGKKSRAVNTIRPLLEAIDKRLPLRQTLRAVYNGLVKSVVQGQTIDRVKFMSLQRLVTKGGWVHVDGALYDGKTLGFVAG